jgi:Bacterial Ig-like domain (group 2)
MPPFDLPKSPAPAAGVNPPNPAPPPTVAPCVCHVTLAPNPFSVCNTTTGTLTATGTPAGGTYAWSSSDTTVATVAGSGATATVTQVAPGRATITVTYSPPACSPCSATAAATTCKCTFGRKYAHADKRAANLIAGRTRIKTRWGKLCCEGCGTTDAVAAAYVNISNSSSGVKWAQVGYSRRRNPGSTSVIQYRKAEIQGNGYNITMDTANAPAEGSVHEWKCELDKTTGQWTYYDNGTAFSPFSDPYWTTALGTVVQWVGEIFNKEDDMPGTASDKCNFTDCQYQVDGGAYVDAGFTARNLTTDDASEWGVELVSTTAINIWDKKPNP